MKHLIPPSLKSLLVWCDTKAKPGTGNTLEKVQFPYVIDIKHIPKPCEDCGLVVVDRHVNYRKYKPKANCKGYVKTTCLACNKCLNPSTGKFDIDSSDRFFFATYYNTQDK